MMIEDGMEDIMQDERDQELINRFVDADTPDDVAELVIEMIDMGLNAQGILNAFEALGKEAN